MNDYINKFWFNQKSSYEDMGLIITEHPVTNVAERDVSFITIPGKSGDLISDNGRYKNITRSYKVAVLEDFYDLPTQIKKLINCISENSYCQLQDTYDSDYFRIAKASGALSIATILQRIGTAAITFNCKPFKYSLCGEKTVVITEAGMIYNAEMFPSKPYIKVFGNGDISLSINHKTYNFTEIDEFIEIDSEIMNAFKGIELCNNKMSSQDFPIFSPGENYISWVGNVEKLEIIPRWCTL